MQTLRTERSAYLALATTASKPDAGTLIDKAHAQREARKMQDRLASLSFAERLKLQIMSNDEGYCDDNPTHV